MLVARVRKTINDRSKTKHDHDSRTSIKKFFHLPHRLLDADDDRAGDDAVADIELDDLGNLRDRQDVFIVEAVAAVHFQPKAARQRRRVRDRRQLALSRCRGDVAVRAGVNFDRVGADFLGCLDLRLRRDR